MARTIAVAASALAPGTILRREGLRLTAVAGDKPFDHMLFHPETYWAERDIGLMTRTRVTSVNAKRKELSVEGGEPINYRHLIWATGGRPRRLACEGSDGAGIFTIRQRRTPRTLQAQVMGTIGSLQIVAFSVGTAIGGPIVVALEPRPSIVLAACLILGSGVIGSLARASGA